MATCAAAAVPPRVRRRYGDELIDLQDELRGERALSRPRLVRDALLGAYLARSARGRALVLGCGLVITALLAAGISVVGAAHPVSKRRVVVAKAVPATRTGPPILRGNTCFIGSGMSCSLKPCAEFTTHEALQPLGPAAAVARAGRARRRRARALCIGDGHNPQPHTLFVANGILSATPATNRRPARRTRPHTLSVTTVASATPPVTHLRAARSSDHARA